MMQDFWMRTEGSVPGWIMFVPVVFLVVMAWSMVWKAIALWRAGQKGQLGWFVALFIINTVGILEIIYLLTAGKKENKPEVNPNL